MATRRVPLAACLFIAAWSVSAAVATAEPRVESTLDLSGIAAFIAGIAYDPLTDHLFVADSTTDQVHEVARADGSLIQSWPVPPGTAGGPAGITYCSANDHLYFVSEIDNRLYEVTKAGALVGIFTFSVPPVSVSGCTYNSLAGTLLVIDDQGGNMIESLLDGTVLAVRAVTIFGIFDGDGIAYNSVDNTVWIGDDIGRRLFEISTDGTILLNIYDLGPTGLATGGVEGLAFDRDSERLFLAHGDDRLVYEISGVTTGGGVAVEPGSWGRIKSSFAAGGRDGVR